MKKKPDQEGLILHLETWKAYNIPWTKEELKEVETLYNAKAPDWAHKACKKG